MVCTQYTLQPKKVSAVAMSYQRNIYALNHRSCLIIDRSIDFVCVILAAASFTFESTDLRFETSKSVCNTSQASQEVTVRNIGLQFLEYDVITEEDDNLSCKKMNFIQAHQSPRTLSLCRSVQMPHTCICISLVDCEMTLG